MLYQGNKGIDLVLQNKEGRLALLEAKHGKGLGSLSIDKAGLRQGGELYNINRLERYIVNAENANVDLANRLIDGIYTREVDSFASFYRSKKLFQLNYDFAPNVNFKINTDAAKLIGK